MGAVNQSAMTLPFDFPGSDQILIGRAGVAEPLGANQETPPLALGSRTISIVIIPVDILLPRHAAAAAARLRRARGVAQAVQWQQRESSKQYRPHTPARRLQDAVSADQTGTPQHRQHASADGGVVSRKWTLRLLERTDDQGSPALRATETATAASATWIAHATAHTTLSQARQATSTSTFDLETW